MRHSSDADRTQPTRLSIDLFGAPPSKEQIASAREACRHEMSLSERTLFFTPVPIVDVLAAATVAIFESAPERELLRDCSEDIPGDWSRSIAASTYLGAVARMGRPLVVKEAQALASHVRVHGASEWALRMAQDVASTLLRRTP